MATISFEVDDNELWSSVFGSGFEMWGWWIVEFVPGTGWDIPGEAHLTLTDPDTGRVEGREVVTVDTLAEVVSGMRLREEDIEDIDAALGDRILQIAVMGREVFG